tara:strand:+ start:651 stop:1739 length:1089 start_codon:yes stop_codon:yes gene_type:complete
MKWILKLLPNKIKVWLYKCLYDDIADKGEYEDTELAHVNPYEVKILKEIGGSGRLNKATGLKGYFGGGGSPAPAPASGGSGRQETISREAPEIEARKLALYDQAINLATEPMQVPEYKVAGPSPLETQAFQQAGQTGIGAVPVQAGIGATLGAGQTAMTDLTQQGGMIDSFMNPYQRYVIDEINRQSQIQSNQQAAEAVASGAFGGGREGVQRAEQERLRLGLIGQAQAEGFKSALGAAERQRQFQTEAQLNQAAQLSALGQTQQTMAQRDIQQQLQGGQLQRDIAQKGLEAQRATEVARQAEPFQRVEFAKGIMTALPTTASQITATTGPGANPLAQAAGAGIGAYAAYNLLAPTGTVPKG